MPFLALNGECLWKPLILCIAMVAMGRPQRYEEFYSGTVRYGIFAKSRYTGIFRYGISPIFSYRDFLEIVRYFLVFLYWCNKWSIKKFASQYLPRICQSLWNYWTIHGLGSLCHTFECDLFRYQSGIVSLFMYSFHFFYGVYL